jgi:hypothetical protein
MNDQPTTLERYAAWLAGDASPETRRAVEAELNDPNSPLSRSLDRVEGIARAFFGAPAAPPAVIPIPWYRRTLTLRNLVAAAAVLLAVTAVWLFVHDLGRDGPSPRPATSADSFAWLRPDAFPTEGTAKQCFDQLAKRLGEWQDGRPTTRAAMARHVAELRLWCTLLQFAELPSLPPAERNWLRDRCREWSLRLSDDLADLEAADGRDPQLVYDRVDRKVKEMIDSLRERGRKVGAA